MPNIHRILLENVLKTAGDDASKAKAVMLAWLNAGRSDALRPGDVLTIEAEPAMISPRCAVAASVRRADGLSRTFNTSTAIETNAEVEQLRGGGILSAHPQALPCRSVTDAGGSPDILRT